MTIEWINKLESHHTNDVGSKATLLSEMCTTSSKFIVPPGFVLSSEVIASFLKNANLESQINSILEEADIKDVVNLQETYVKIRELILNSHFDKKFESKLIETYKQIGLSEEIREYGAAMDLVRGHRDNQLVAIRPSPLRGINVYKTALNIAGKESVLTAIKEAIASYYSPEALAYRENVKSNPGLSIIVQRMVGSEKAVSVFTSNPIGNASEVIVEAAWGLGNALSEGIVSPDQYRIDKNSGQLIEEKINLKDWMFSIDNVTNKVIKEKVPSEMRNRSVLTTKELGRVFESALLIESRLSTPHKITFSINRGKVILLGVEKISIQNTNNENENSESLILEGMGASAGFSIGKTRVIYDPQEISEIDENGILVTVNSSIDFLTGIQAIGGMITDEGSLSSKLATVFRDIDIPLVVGTKTATEVLNSIEISLDGLNGQIFERPEQISYNFESEPLTSELITGIDIKTIGVEKIPGSDGAVVLDPIGVEEAKNLALNYASGNVWIKSNQGYSSFDTQYYENYSSFDNLPENVEFIHTDFNTIQHNPRRPQGVVLRDFASLMQLEDYINVINFVVIDLNNLSRSFGHSSTHPAVLNSVKKVHEFCRGAVEISIVLDRVNPRLIEHLIELGADSFVVAPEDFNRVKEILARKEQKFIIKKLRRL